MTKLQASAACGALVLTCLTVPLCFGTAANGADNDGSRDSARPVVIEQCRIKLIDQVTLASDRVGILAHVAATEGDAVREGEQIARLNDHVAAAALAIAEEQAVNDIEIRYAEKAAQVAEAEHRKSLEANRLVPGAVPGIEVQRQKLAAERSVLQIEQAENQLHIHRLSRDQAAAELETYRVLAPFDGVVTRVYKSKGEAVRQGDPILELTSTRRVRVEGNVDVADVWSVQAGAPVRVRLDVPGIDLAIEREVFEGRISFVDVSVQPVTRQVRVWAEVANRDNILRAGLAATMEVQPADRPTPEAAARSRRNR